MTQVKSFLGIILLPYLICFFAENGVWPSYPASMQSMVHEMSQLVLTQNNEQIRAYCRGKFAHSSNDSIKSAIIQKFLKKFQLSADSNTTPTPVTTSLTSETSNTLTIADTTITPLPLANVTTASTPNINQPPIPTALPTTEATAILTSSAATSVTPLPPDVGTPPGLPEPTTTQSTDVAIGTISAATLPPDVETLTPALPAEVATTTLANEITDKLTTNKAWDTTQSIVDDKLDVALPAGVATTTLANEITDKLTTTQSIVDNKLDMTNDGSKNFDGDSNSENQKLLLVPFS